jgi:hypothetical protein
MIESTSESGTKEYDDLSAAVRAAMKGAKTPEEYEKFAAALKGIAEAATAKGSLSLQLKNTSLERLKSWATIVVPAISILGLCGTVWLQSSQLDASRISAEDAQWNTTLTALTAPDAGPQSGYISVERLKPFLRKGRYVEDARDISSLLLGRIVSREIFDDLFEATFPHPEMGDLQKIIRIERALNENYDSTDAILKKMRDATGPLNAKQLAMMNAPNLQRRGLPTASIKDEAEHAIAETSAEVFVAGKLLGDLLRARKGKAPLDLTGMWLRQTDLHDANLQNVDLSQTAINNVDLKGADLRGITLTDLSTERWWLASAIDKDTIEWAMKYFYPYSFNADGGNIDNSQWYQGEAVTKEEYSQNINRLCKNAGCTVKDSDIMFGPTAPNPPPPEKDTK